MYIFRERDGERWREKERDVEFVTVIYKHLFMLNIHEYIINDRLKVHAQNCVLQKDVSDTHAEAVAVYALLCHDYYSCGGCGCLPAEVTPCQLASLFGSAHSSSSTSH